MTSSTREVLVCVLFLFSCRAEVVSSNSPGGSGGAGDGAGGEKGFTLPDSGPPKQGGSGGMSMYAGGVTRPCVDLECRQSSCQMGSCAQQAACAGGAKTTLSGRVYDPAGKVPLYNIVVYVPNAPLDPIASGPTCELCATGLSGKPIAAALTNTSGDFVLENVPVGTAVPLVVQIGKWRRQIELPEIKACTDNKLDDKNLLRLPRNQKEGHIPKIALATGGWDKLECLLRKMGVEDSEFTPESGPGRINFFHGRGTGEPGKDSTAAYAPALNGGAAFTDAPTWWNGANPFAAYDLVILSCEGLQFASDKRPAAHKSLMDYANKGGRVFASHWQNIWFEEGPAPWPTVATFGSHPDLPSPFTADIDTSFPKGAALAEWLVNVQASPTSGKITIEDGQHTVSAVNPALSRRWIYSTAVPHMPSTGVEYLTFNTPAGAGATNECGRAVFTDIHVSAGDMAGPPFPMGCVTPDLSPQEKALEFMLFDLSSCIQPDDQPPRIVE
jgi:hypothetical protein